MAVQQRRRTRSTRGLRRGHDKITNPTLAHDSETGDTHRRHHITAEGYYRGRQVIDNTPEADEDDE